MELINGWRDVSEYDPEKDGDVIVTNNPKARDAHGNMSHVWIATIHESSLDSGEFVSFTSDSPIIGIKAWHVLPGNATED